MLKNILARIRKKIAREPANKIIAKVFHKIFLKISDYFRYQSDLRNRKSLSNVEFFDALGFKAIRIETSDDLVKKLELNRVLDSFIDTKDIRSFIDKISNDDKDSIIKSADDIILHRFDLLGSGKVNASYNLNPAGIENISYNMKLEVDEIEEIKKKIIKTVNCLDINLDPEKQYEPVNWHVDFKSGYIWSRNIWYKKIKIGGFPGADIKVPWELSRFHHLVTLGQAYLISGNESYTQEYILEVIDWIENNKLRFGVNWKCTMDVAIRAANMICGLAFFKDSPSVSCKFLVYLLKNIYIHGLHIVNNLEYGSITSNHYLSDISGLVFVAEILSRSKIGKKWKYFAVEELKKEMVKQVYDDGVDFESSICYHRLVLELFFYPTLLLIKSDADFYGNNYAKVAVKIFGEKYLKRLYKMFDFVFHIARASRKTPQIGDNDNGRLLVFGERDVLDLGYLLTYASIFFNSSKFNLKENGFYNEAFWIFGFDSCLKSKGRQCSNSFSSIKSKSFKNAGIYVMRDRFNYLIASCGPVGQNGNGGHSHNDKLSFELSLNGEDVFIDSGTYVYTPFPELRNKFRSTEMHNTVRVDKTEQNRFSLSNLFSMEDDTKVEICQWIKNESYDFLDARHFGYKFLNQKIIHRRKIFFNKNNFFLAVKDIFEGEGIHLFEWTFNPSVGLNCSIDENNCITRISGKNVSLNIIPLQNRKIDSAVTESLYSGSYGQNQESKKIKYSITAEAPFENIFIFLEEKSLLTLEEVQEIIKKII